MKEPVSLFHHSQARDYLIFMVVHSNAQRSGVAKGMQVEEVKNAIWRAKDQRYVTLVKEHKTGLHGPVPIIVTKELYKSMKKYLELFRPVAVEQQHEPDCGYFFVKRTGGQLNRSRIASIFNFLGKRYGRKDKGRMFPTKFRQTAATSVSKKPQEQREDLSRLLTHKESTGRLYYVIEDTNRTLC